MAIKPLQHAFAPTVYSPEPAAQFRNGTGSAFDSVLSSLASAEGGPVKAQQAAADLLRMEMMHHSLALTCQGDSSTPSGITALESLVSRQAATCRPEGVKGADGRTTDGGAALMNEIAAGTTSPGSGEVDGIGKTAAQFVGTPYRFGGQGPDGIDCSSFVQQVFREHQIDLPRTAREQSKVGVDVSGQDLRKGDLIFFHTYASYPSHVGIYLGDGKMIHASSAKGAVTVSDINSSYYRSHFLGARRIA